jgi:UDP-N-acetyl-2-amino-2-deoxyglucuronate dehydrogenase
MAKPLRFGLLGCGVIGQTHAAAIASLPDARLVAVAARNSSRAAELGARHGAAAYATLQDMLDLAHLDVVAICTPSGRHGADACQVMRAGCHVVVEKPMDIRRAAMDEMLAVQQEMGVKLAVISQHRFDPASQQVQQLVAAGRLGRLVLGNAAVLWWRPQAYYDQRSWRGTAELDGGVLMNQAIHSIDLLQWFMGPVRSVYAYSDTLTHRIEAADTGVAALRFASGALGAISATTAAHPGDITRIEVFGDQGCAVIENNNLAYLRVMGEEQPVVAAVTLHSNQLVNLEGARGLPPPLGSHAWQIADLIRAIRQDGTPAVDGYTGRQPVDIILAIYESAASGHEVVLP